MQCPVRGSSRALNIKQSRELEKDIFPRSVSCIMYVLSFPGLFSEETDPLLCQLQVAGSNLMLLQL